MYVKPEHVPFLKSMLINISCFGKTNSAATPFRYTGGRYLVGINYLWQHNFIFYLWSRLDGRKKKKKAFTLFHRVKSTKDAATVLLLNSVWEWIWFGVLAQEITCSNKDELHDFCINILVRIYNLESKGCQPIFSIQYWWGGKNPVFSRSVSNDSLWR